MVTKTKAEPEQASERARLDKIINKYRKQKGALIPILQEAQDSLGYLSEESLFYIAKATKRTLAQVYGVTTFFTQFRLEPIGEHLVRICHGTACHVGGAEDIDATVCGHLGLSEEGGTTDDMEFTVDKVVCVGACSLAPIMIVDGVAHGRLNADRARKVIKGYQKEK
ncbi:MAG: NAD(P)H-dependent oxidoreductase subunit E [Actinobacteria bacterium]|nr:NAD(P)H-dependent oxidoreductase subunit E [Actinomycetota bacterium]